ncbi:MAG: NADPH-dependent FMN reductase [Candidatus Babeliaceae bacterium]
MNYKNILIFALLLGVPLSWSLIGSVKQADNKKIIKIILGSTRQGRMSDKIGAALQKMASKRTDVRVEIADLRDYNLPFLNDAISPIYRKEITDPVIQKWSDTIQKADAFIIVVPEYNAGYPGVLKNALDLLYEEWNKKPVAFVGYSGGKNGGANAVAQLRHVVKELKMIPVSAELLIPSSWGAFDSKGQLQDVKIEKALNTMIDQLIAQSASQTLIT